jgi:hypothetical protein
MPGEVKKGGKESKTHAKETDHAQQVSEKVEMRQEVAPLVLHPEEAVNDKAWMEFQKDWSYHYASHTLAGFGGDDRNAKFLAVNHVAIPCRAEDLGDKAVAISLTLLKAQSAGFGVAPFDKKMKKGTETKKLFEMISATAADAESTTQMPEPSAGMRMWSYEKKSMARGPRCDDMSFDLHTGDTLIYFVSQQTFEGMKLDDPSSATNALPIDLSCIPEMSLLEITIAPKNRDSCLAGSGVRVMTIRLADPSVSLYSLLPSDLRGLPRSLRQYQEVVTARKEKFPMVAKDFEENRAAFFLNQCPVTTFINDEHLASGTSSMVQLVMGPGVLDDSDFIDIHIATLLKYTNTADVKHACALMECAAALGALRVFVTFNPFWGRKGASCYRGIPIIDSGVFFQAITKDFLQGMPAQMTASPMGITPTTVKAPTESIYDALCIDLEIAAAPIVVKTETSVGVPTPDFAIVGPGFAIPKAYNFFVNLRSPAGDSHDDVSGVFSGFFNVSCVGGGAAGAGSWGGSSKFKRRKLGTMA